MNMNMQRREFAIGAGALLIFALSVFLIYSSDGRGGVATNSASTGETEIPPMTALMKQVLEKSTGFQLLVSYESGGFAPVQASIKAGDTVRFVNNSDSELWVSAAAVHSATIYPGGSENCGQSEFDSCARLKPAEFWEFTFTEPGVWGYRNTAEPAHEASLEVI